MGNLNIYRGGTPILIDRLNIDMGNLNIHRGSLLKLIDRGNSNIHRGSLLIDRARTPNRSNSYY